MSARRLGAAVCPWDAQEEDWTDVYNKDFPDFSQLWQPGDPNQPAFRRLVEAEAGLAWLDELARCEAVAEVADLDPVATFREVLLREWETHEP